VATVATGSLGLLDDIESVAHKRSLGLTPTQKMAGLIVISVAFCLCAVNLCGISAEVRFPGGLAIDLGVLTTTLDFGGTIVSIPWLYVLFVFLLMAGLSNAVNLTDGLDGLAGGCVMVVMLVMAMVAFNYDELNLAVFAGSIAGACVGFLWYNSYPASIFMGDTGSLALGAALAALAVLTKTEVTSLVMGGSLHRRGPLRHNPGGELQAHGQEGLPHGAHPSPLREEGLVGDEGRLSLLDHLRSVRRARFAFYFQLG